MVATVTRRSLFFDWILEVIEFSGLRQFLDFEIGKHGLILRTPVNDPVAAIDHSLFVQPHEHFAHRARQILVHRELLARPVDRSAFATHLHGDLSARFVFPLPNALDKLLAPEIVPRLPFLLQRARDHQLRRDAGVVHPRQPKRAIPTHSLVPRHHIHHRVLQRMAHVQRAGNVWRRNHDGEYRRLRIAIYLRREIAILLPPLIVVLLRLFGVVLFGDFHAVSLCSSYRA